MSRWRILASDDRALVVPVDHAVTLGPVTGLADATALMAQLADARPDAVLVHRGLFQHGLVPTGEVGLIAHLSASTTMSGEPEVKTLVCDVEDAVRLGADAVSYHLSLGTAHEREALRAFADVSSDCMRWGMPLLAMAYTYGGAKVGPEAVAHAARVAAELGADLVKVPYTGSAETFAAVVEGCFAPVLVAGGEDLGDALIDKVAVAVPCGAIGACVGRGVFQSYDAPGLCNALRAVIHAADVDPRLEEVRRRDPSVLV